MQTDFIKQSIKDLLPLILLCSYLFISGHLSSDFYFHIGNFGQADYPPLLSWLLPPANRAAWLFMVNLIFTILFPYIIIHQIKGRNAAFAYLYSGIPLILFVVWLVPQAIIHVLMLLMIREPKGGTLAFLAIGWLTHSFWWAGFLLVLGYLAYKRFYNAG